MGLTILLGVFRWRRVLRVQGLELPLGRAAEISLVAHFFNSFLLGSTGGDLMKAYYAARETHHLKAEAVVTVVADRLIGLFSMLFFACVMVVPNLALLTTHRRLGAITLFTFLMMMACGALIGLAFWGGLSRRWPHARSWLRRLPKGDLLERSLDSCRRFGQQPVVLGETLAISMGLNVASVCQVMFLAWGMHLSIPPLALFAIVPMIICISALPITPSGLGVRENLYVLMLGAPAIAIGPTQALSLSLLAYACSLFWSVVGAAVYVGLKDRRHLVDVASDQLTAG
jgi:glycosyltransferase 2 family protein